MQGVYLCPACALGLHECEDILCYCGICAGEDDGLECQNDTVDFREDEEDVTD